MTKDDKMNWLLLLPLERTSFTSLGLSNLLKRSGPLANRERDRNRDTHVAIFHLLFVVEGRMDPPLSSSSALTQEEVLSLGVYSPEELGTMFAPLTDPWLPVPLPIPSPPVEQNTPPSPPVFHSEEPQLYVGGRDHSMFVPWDCVAPRLFAIAVTEFGDAVTRHIFGTDYFESHYYPTESSYHLSFRPLRVGRGRADKPTQFLFYADPAQALAEKMIRPIALFRAAFSLSCRRSPGPGSSEEEDPMVDTPLPAAIVPLPAAVQQQSPVDFRAALPSSILVFSHSFSSYYFSL